MRLLFRWRCVFVTVMAVLASAGARASDRWFAPGQSRLFRDWRGEVQALVDAEGRGGPTRLCLVTVQDGGDINSAQTYVYWPDADQLITWRPSTNGSRSLLHETNVLHLRSDVVPTEDDINGSTYLVSRAWVADIRRHCRQDGVTVKVTPHGTR